MGIEEARGEVKSGLRMDWVGSGREEWGGFKWGRVGSRRAC